VIGLQLKFFNSFLRDLLNIMGKKVKKFGIRFRVARKWACRVLGFRAPNARKWACQVLGFRAPNETKWACWVLGFRAPNATKQGL